MERVTLRIVLRGVSARSDNSSRAQLYCLLLEVVLKVR